MSSLTLKRMRVGPFHGINPDKPLVIEFPTVKKNTKKRPIGIVSGDMGRGKSSFIYALLYAAKQKFGIRDQDLINNKSGLMNGELEFEKDGESWKVMYTKTTFKLYRLFKAGDDEGWIPHGKEETELKSLIGNVAISPMKLKTDDGKKQVDWLFKMLNVPEDVVEEAQRLGRQINDIVAKRADCNKEYEYLKKKLHEDPMFLNWEASEKKYAEKKTIETVREKVDRVTREKMTFDKGKDKLEGIVHKITEREAEIKDLKAKLAAAVTDLETLKSAKAIGDDFMEKNKGVVAAYDAAHLELITISQYLAELAQWEKIQADKIEMDEYETLIQKGDNGKDKLRKKKRDLLKNVLPDIPGMEIYTEDVIDGKKAGIYVDGKNPMQLSESELFDLYFKLCQVQGVTMVVVDNLTSFGTDVVKTLNAMAKAGVYVWATQMVRGQKELQIEFIDEIK